MEYPPTAGLLRPRLGGPLPQRDCGGTGRVREGTWAFFPISQLRVKRDSLKTIQRELGGHEGGLQERHVVPTQPKRW